MNLNNAHESPRRPEHPGIDSAAQLTLAGPALPLISARSMTLFWNNLHLTQKELTFPAGESNGEAPTAHEHVRNQSPVCLT